jgi:hypothetical protein
METIGSKPDRTPEPNIEVVPESGFTQGKLNPEGRCIAALNALPFDIEPLDELGVQWRVWCFEHPWIARLARRGLEIARAQVEILARRLTRDYQAEKSAKITGEFYQSYLRLVAEQRELRSFLLQHFPDDIERAEAGNRPLPEVARDIMLRHKG